MKNACKYILTYILLALLFICVPSTTRAQRWSVSTNALQWATLGTINAEGGYSLNQNFSLSAGFAVNPWLVNSPTSIQMRNNQFGGYCGVKYWPWHVYSEWWFGAKIQYKQFEQVGILTSNLVKGDAIGAGLSAGYSFMLGNHFNLDLGVGVWGGKIVNYAKYKGNTTVDSKLLEQGSKGFVFLDNLILSIIYIF